MCFVSSQPYSLNPNQINFPSTSIPDTHPCLVGQSGLPMFTLSRVLLRTSLPFGACLHSLRSYSEWAASHPRAPSPTPSHSRMCPLPPLQPTPEQDFRRPPPSHSPSSQGTETLGCARWGSGAGRLRVSGTSFCLGACGFCWWQLCACRAGGLRRCNARG